MILDKNFEYYRTSVLQESINQGFIPRFLYKYVSMETAIKILENSTLKFSIPTEFNDPFDCKANLQVKCSLQDVFIQLYRMFHSKYTLNELYRYAMQIYMDPKKMEYLCKCSLEEVINKSGVCCFSQINNQILMWSHYADKHTGVCFKFDMCQDLDFFCPIGIVRYKTEFLEYNYTIDPEFVIEHVCRKAKDWEYEKEIRIVKTNKFGLLPFNVNSLVGIIFGCRMNEQERCLLKNIVLKMKYPNISFQEAIAKHGEYALDIIDVPS